MGRRKNVAVDHHWVGLNPQPEVYRGFVYEITNNINGMRYIGRKLMWRVGKRGKIIKYPWENYTGSSRKLNDDINKHGKDNFTFKIVRLFKTKSGLRYGEVERIVKADALTKNRDLYYNGAVDKCYTPIEWYEGRRRVDNAN